jgi:hypothetical protein
MLGVIYGKCGKIGLCAECYYASCLYAECHDAMLPLRDVA